MTTSGTAVLDADAIIRLLGLVAHPEGGYFRETFRDERRDDTGREASTAIYYLLRAGEVSRWHRVDAAETWHWYAGAPIELQIAIAGQPRQRLLLGPDLASAERPQIVVPAGAWQSARSKGAHTLVGCTVAPAFSFSGFELAPPGFEP